MKGRGIVIRNLRFDSGGEFTGEEVADMCATNGVSTEFAAPDRHLTGERLHNMLNRCTRANLVGASANTSVADWDRARLHGCYAYNAAVKPSLGTTRHQALFGTNQDLSALIPFGSVVAIYDSTGPNGLANKAIVAIYLCPVTVAGARSICARTASGAQRIGSTFTFLGPPHAHLQDIHLPKATIFTPVADGQVHPSPPRCGHLMALPEHDAGDPTALPERDVQSSPPKVAT